MEHKKYTCDICNKEFPYESDLIKGPFSITINAPMSGKVFYRRQISSHGCHMCGNCMEIFTKHIHEEVLAGFTSHVTDYEAIGPK